MRYKNLILIGSVHVSKDSVDLVKKTIEEEKPEVVAIELDQDRLGSLLSKQKGKKLIRGVGFKGMLFAIIGEWVENKIGKSVNVSPGAEMKAAFYVAKEQGAKVALIDQNITITLKRFSQTITWKEKWRFFVDIMSGIIFPKKQAKELGIDEQKLLSTPDKKMLTRILSFVKRRYPNVYLVLVHERNVVMAKNLAILMRKFDGKIVAVVGAGHEEGIIKLLKEKVYKETKA
ncbi:MAG TPA: TraB/GumN family protein [Candidatus Nanoarchaeia archaeon]|nr:TraB/GumN family protein [Candidatus Nanoarchaeia archaeon]